MAQLIKPHGGILCDLLIQGEKLNQLKKDSLHFFIAADQNIAPEYINYLPPIILSFIFMVIFYLFINHFFRPIRWINKRISGLGKGDMKSQIKIKCL